jgi:hypothetical protein
MRRINGNRRLRSTPTSRREPESGELPPDRTSAVPSFHSPRQMSVLCGSCPAAWGAGGWSAEVPFLCGDAVVDGVGPAFGLCEEGAGEEDVSGSLGPDADSEIVGGGVAFDRDLAGLLAFGEVVEELFHELGRRAPDQRCPVQADLGATQSVDGDAGQALMVSVIERDGRQVSRCCDGTELGLPGKGSRTWVAASAAIR